MTTMIERATVRVTPAQPFDFGSSLRFLARFPAMAGEQRIDRGMLVRVTREAGVLAVLRVSEDGASLVYDIESEDPIPTHVATAISDRLSCHLGVYDDVAEFYRLAEGDPPFQAVIDQLYGYHHVKFPLPLELMTWAILCQRVPMPVARKM